MTIVVAILFLLVLAFWDKARTKASPAVTTNPNDFSTCIREEFGYDGGEMVVGKNNWYIEFRRRPDRRYRTRIHRIWRDDVSTYISALRSNWSLFNKVKSELVSNSELETRGQLDMLVRAGARYREGIWLRFEGHYYLFVSNEESLEKLISCLEDATRRATQIMSFLNDRNTNF
jgi:hypothetical protein